MIRGKRQSQLFWFGLLAGMNVFWSFSYVVVKYGLSSMNPLELVFFRFVLALAVMLGIVVAGHKTFSMRKRDILGIIAAGCLLGLSNWLWVTGIGMSHATDASLLYAFEPVWGILLAGIILKEKIRWTTIAGLLLVIGGLFYLSNYDIRGLGFGDERVAFGNVFVVVGLFCEGFFSVVLKPVSSRVDPAVITTGVLAVAIAVMSAPLAMQGGLNLPKGAPAYLSIAYLSLVCTVLGYTLWIAVMKHVPVGIMLFTIFIQPIVGPFAAHFFLGESINLRVVTGGGLLIVGMFVAVYGHIRLGGRIKLSEEEKLMPIPGGV